MKRIVPLLLMLLLAFSLSACGNRNENAESPSSALSEEATQTSTTAEPSASADAPSGESTASQPTEENGSNILVAYFSRVGNTDFEEGVDAVASASLNLEGDSFVGNAEVLARMAQQETGGELFLIETAEKYPSDYDETTDVAADEQGDNARPELTSHVENMDQYDTVILIYPNWWGTLPQPLFTFLEEYDFSGKTILPLCTHAGSRMGRSEQDIDDLCPEANLIEGLAVSGSSVNEAGADVAEWITNSGILE
ncbi:MAG: NAD(P)H-dependent oxidoreductase [Clostridiales bacterium]|nr:NAD(P)H-dependent oxidoreductase [Clostridiales bacterium]